MDISVVFCVSYHKQLDDVDTPIYAHVTEYSSIVNLSSNCINVQTISIYRCVGVLIIYAAQQWM